MQIRWFIKNSVRKYFIGHKTMRFLDSVISSDESMFHVSGKVKTHNCRIWDSENPCVFLEHVSDSPKVNVFLRHQEKNFTVIQRTLFGVMTI
jgi:hypothetical protein